MTIAVVIESHLFGVKAKSEREMAGCGKTPNLAIEKHRREAMARLSGTFLSLMLCSLALTVSAEPARISILHVNDWDRMEEADGRGGAARLMSVIAAERGAGDGSLLVTHGGDAISPSLLSGFDRGQHVIDLLNRLDLTAFVPGNHEFDFGPDVAVDRFAEADFPVISSNILTGGGGRPAGTVESLRVDVDGFAFGFIGLTTPAAAVTSTPGDLVFEDPLAVAERLAGSLRQEGADLVVALAHLSVPEDLALVRSGVVDIVLSGDDHLLMALYDGRAALIESGSQAETVQILDLTVERVERDGEAHVVWRPAFRSVDTADFEADPEIGSVVQGHMDRLSAELDTTVGTTETALDSRRAVVRGGEAAIGNLIADAMRAGVDADVAITNGGGIRADRTYDAGTVLTRRDVLSELPFGNSTVKLEVSGAALVDALEHGLTAYGTGAGRFPQVSGLSVTFDPAAAVGARVIEVRVGDAVLDPSATYALATNDFLAGGGDGYGMFVDAPRLIGERDAQLMAGHVIEFIAQEGAVAPRVEGRIQVVP